MELLPLVKRFVLETPLYYDEEVNNYVAVHPEDDLLSREKQLEIGTKHGFFKFVILVRSFVTVGSIALNYQQRKKYHLKFYRRYVIRLCAPITLSRTLSDIINDRFDFKSKIGGMENVFEEIFTSVLLPRLYPQNFFAKTGINHTRGLLLHGPPGTGKTLIAQTVCGLLNVTPKIVRGPEIFSCMLGDSEKRIRDLFDDAREDQLNFGASSKLNVIVFDEIDAICKRRGNRNEIRETVHDNVTTQFLAEIDGMIQLDNILLIGTTNNLDIIDPAILRPGRIEMLIKIEPPDANARFCIFDIHTKALLRNGALSSDVDVSNIIRYTDGLTGPSRRKKA